ncbi:MAG: tRNA 2-thiouridine(34) synthase MnmA [Oscillospiraceae bacterium]
MTEKVMIGMSGGVDSSVSALLLQDEGWRCLGVTLKLYTNEAVGLPQGHTCCSLDDVEDARSAAFRLGMPHYVFNAEEAFETHVIRNFIDVYEAGGTPNPCIQCNKHLKFSYMLRKARELGCEYIATGHYARIEQRGDGRWLLKKGLDASKDQSYVLYVLTQDTLAHTKFPLGGLTKAQVRALAAERGLLNARKHDSQDICFVPDGDYEGFIRRRTGRDYPAGDFVDGQGNILGRHRGMIGYTIGQRRGLGVSGGRPLYVCRKNISENTITLAENDALFSQSLTARAINLIDRERIDGALRCTAKIRYSHGEAACTVTQTEEDELCVSFDEPQRAVTAGQAVVLYDGDTVIGGGTIQ